MMGKDLQVKILFIFMKKSGTDQILKKTYPVQYLEYYI